MFTMDIISSSRFPLASETELNCRTLDIDENEKDDAEILQCNEGILVKKWMSF